MREDRVSTASAKRANRPGLAPFGSPHACEFEVRHEPVKIIRGEAIVYSLVFDTRRAPHGSWAARRRSSRYRPRSVVSSVPPNPSPDRVSAPCVTAGVTIGSTRDDRDTAGRDPIMRRYLA